MKKISKVIIYMPYLGSGGVETAYYNLGVGFRNRGWHTTFICDNASKAHNVGKFEGLGEVVFLGKRSYFSIANLYREIKRIKPDLIVSGQTPCNLNASVLSRCIGGFVHKPVLHVSIDKQSAGLKRFVSKLTYALISHLSNSLICVSEGLSQEVKSYKWVKKGAVQTIYNALYPSFEIDKRTFVSDGFLPKKIISSGRFTEQKNFDFLIDVFHKYLDIQPCAELTILGEGSLRLDLENKIAELSLTDKVSLPGHVSNVEDFLIEADVFILTSLYEGFGIVLIDALKCATPIITIDCPHGPKEIVENTSYGMLIEDYNVDLFVDAIRKVHNVEFDNDKIFNYLNCFTVEKVVDKYVS